MSKVKKLLKACKEAEKWIRDSYKMMNDKSCGWPDASDSLAIAQNILLRAVKEVEVKNVVKRKKS